MINGSKHFIVYFVANSWIENRRCEMANIKANVTIRPATIGMEDQPIESNFPIAFHNGRGDVHEIPLASIFVEGELCNGEKFGMTLWGILDSWHTTMDSNNYLQKLVYGLHSKDKV
jgi:hypothetical protein